MTDPAACAALVARTLERFGALEILVNNAGLGLYGSVAEGDPEDWRMMFEVNVLGALYTTRAAVRHILEKGSGDVVLVSSLAGRRVPDDDGTAYAATKHAITAIAEGLSGRTREGYTRHQRRTRPRQDRVPKSSHPSAEEFYAGKSYIPLEAQDIAAAVLYAVEQPERVSLNEVVVRPTRQPN